MTFEKKQSYFSPHIILWLFQLHSSHSPSNVLTLTRLCNQSLRNTFSSEELKETFFKWLDISLPITTDARNKGHLACHHSSCWNVLWGSACQRSYKTLQKTPGGIMVIDRKSTDQSMLMKILSILNTIFISKNWVVLMLRVGFARLGQGKCDTLSDIACRTTWTSSFMTI